MSILETGFGLIVAATILVQVLFEEIVLVFLKTILLVFLEVTVPVFLEMILVHATLETNPRCTFDDSKPEPLAKSAEMKRLVGIAVANGTPIRVAYKDVRRRMRIEARRQTELDEGAEPEVVLDSFLDQVKVEQQQQSGPLKRVLTPSAKAAKHRRAKDKKWRETMCWWIANDKVCPHGDRCNFRHTVSTSALSPSPAPEQTMC